MTYLEAGRLADSGVGPLLDHDIAHISRVLDTNTVSILRVSKAVTPYMAKKGRGLIVNIGSIVEDV